MISLADVLEETSQFHPEIVIGEKHSYSFIDLALMTEDQQSFESNVLYFVLASVIGKHLHRFTNIALLLVKDCSQSYAHLDTENIVIVEYPHDIDFNQLFNTVRALFHMKWKYLKSSEKLLQAYINSKSLADLAEVASHMLKNPVEVVDTSYKIIAYSKSYHTDDLPWLQTIERGYFTYEYIASIYRFISLRTFQENNEPYYQKVDLAPARRLISRIYSSGTFIGYLVTLETNEHFKEIDMNIFKLISNVFAKAIKFERDLQIKKGFELYEYLLIDLIEENIPTRALFSKRIKNTDLEKYKAYQIISIDISNYSHKNATDDNLKHLLKIIFPNSWSFHYKMNIIVLVGSKGNDCIVDQARHAFEKSFEINSLRAGMSDQFSDLFEISLYLDQACKALHISKLLKIKGCLFDYEQFKFYDMALSTCKTNDLMELNNYCSSVLFKIKSYDTQHSTFYFETLWTYLNCNNNLILTSQSLHVHKNTVAYRINKLKELFSIDSEDNFMLFRLYYSYLLLELIR